MVQFVIIGKIASQGKRINLDLHNLLQKLAMFPPQRPRFLV